MNLLLRHHRLRLFLVLLLAAPALHAQSVEVERQARADVEHLASSELKGRGYLHGGHARAAAYIRDRFIALGLDSFPGGYYQRFQMEVNEFPSSPRLRMNGRELKLGAEFIPDEASEAGTSSESGRFVVAGSGVMTYSDTGMVDEYQGRDVRGATVVLDEAVPANITSDSTIDRAYLRLGFRIGVIEQLGGKGAVVITDRLTFGKATGVYPIPVLRLLRSVMPDSITELSFRVDARVENIISQNVAGFIRGTKHPERFLVICAHYDHLGSIGGDIYFPGANDNASGVAMLLSLARHFREHPPAYSIAFIAFSGEEAGLIGSSYFAEHPLFDLSKVRFLLNVDMTASGREGITAVGGAVYEEEFELLKDIARGAGVEDVRKREMAPNSDHYPIVRQGVRGFYVYPFTGYQPYHHIDDKPETLQWDVFQRLREIFARFLVRLQKD